jgi:hypothetical protein
MTARAPLLSTQVVVLKIDGLRLMLPQGDIRTLESAADIVRSNPPENGSGWIAYAGQNWPVYCLSDELGFLTEVPATRRACVLLARQSGYLGLLCDDASILAHFSGQVHAVPAAMSLPESPLNGLIMAEDGLVCVSNAGLLAQFMDRSVSMQ